MIRVFTKTYYRGTISMHMCGGNTLCYIRRDSMLLMDTNNSQGHKAVMW